jgi:hypothetical protein
MNEQEKVQEERIALLERLLEGILFEDWRSVGSPGEFQWYKTRRINSVTLPERAVTS